MFVGPIYHHCFLDRKSVRKKKSVKNLLKRTPSIETDVAIGHSSEEQLEGALENNCLKSNMANNSNRENSKRTSSGKLSSKKLLKESLGRNYG